MADEKIAGLMKSIDFEKKASYWMVQFEKRLHVILKYEYYLDRIPENLALPKYRYVIIRLVFRMLNQVPKDQLSFSRDLEKPDLLLKEILDYLGMAEIRRKKEILNRNPVTSKSIKSTLLRLRRDFEI